MPDPKSSLSSPSSTPSLSSPSSSLSSSMLPTPHDCVSSKFFDKTTYLIVVILFMVTLNFAMVTVESKSLPEANHKGSKRISDDNDYHVRNRNDALRYLQKYGYMEECNIRSKQRAKPETSLTSIRGIANKTKLKFCSSKKQKEALRIFQETFEIPVTETLDEVTKNLMEINRCGNKDIEKKTRRSKRHVSESYDSMTNDANDNSSERNVWNSNHPHFPDSHEDVFSEFPPDPRYRKPNITEFVDNRTSRERILQLYNSIRARVIAESNLTSARDAEERNITLDMEDEINRTRFRGKRSAYNPYEPHVRTPKELGGDKMELKWRLLYGDSDTLDYNEQRSAITTAFRMWSDCVPLTFKELTYTNVVITDTFIRFAKGDHMHCHKIFDGRGGELAHSWAFGDIHFDGAEKFKERCIIESSSGVDLLKVAIHEIGHVLGLLHTESMESIMFPLYMREINNHYEYEIPRYDRLIVQNLYGVCQLSFDSAFDLVHIEDGKFVYTTFFTSGSRYWKYSNRNRRTISDEEPNITFMWPEIEERRIDSYLQVNHTEAAYIFAGNHSYHLNESGLEFTSDQPQLITDVFPAKEGIEPVPADLDASFYYWTNYIYLVKHESVWICNAFLIGQPGCCFDRLHFTDVFISQKSKVSVVNPNITGNISSIFYTHHYNRYIMLIDTQYFEIKASFDKDVPLTGPGVPSNASAYTKFYIYLKGNIFRRWLDICP